MKELNKPINELPDGFYMVKDGILYSVDVKTYKEKSIAIPPSKIAPDDELQHVEYTSAQCGYEK